MRIAVHDYSGHPFQVQLSRELARMGHDVLHLYFESFPTPKGGVHRRPDDSPNLEIEGLRFAEEFPKYGHFIQRRHQEIRYGWMAARRLARFKPDLILSANTPLDAQRIIQHEAKRMGAQFIFWLQDLYSAGITTFLRKRHFPLAPLISAWYRRMEGQILRSSDAVVPISADFLPALERWHVEPARTRCVENWAPVNELTPRAQDNPWSRTHGLAGKFVYLYAGTLGLKHEPRLLLDLAESLTGDSVVLVVASGTKISGRNLKVLPSQPWELMPEVLATGSVLLALLDEDSGGFSVPSKVLSYLCAARPLLLSVPAGNAAARIVRENSAGLVVPPEDSRSFIAAARQLADDPVLRSRCAANGVSYARRTFDIERIARRILPESEVPKAMAACR